MRIKGSENEIFPLRKRGRTKEKETGRKGKSIGVPFLSLVCGNSITRIWVACRIIRVHSRRSVSRVSSRYLRDFNYVACSVSSSCRPFGEEGEGEARRAVMTVKLFIGLLGKRARVRVSTPLPR